MEQENSEETPKMIETSETHSEEIFEPEKTLEIENLESEAETTTEAVPEKSEEILDLASPKTISEESEGILDVANEKPIGEESSEKAEVGMVEEAAENSAEKE